MPGIIHKNAKHFGSPFPTGMRLEFVAPTRKPNKGLYWQPTPQRRHKPEYVNISLWKYPLDTVIQKEFTKNYMFSLPSTEAVDLISINYRIKNDPIEIYSKTDTSNFLFFQIPTGKYLMTCSPSDHTKRTRHSGRTIRKHNHPPGRYKPFNKSPHPLKKIIRTRFQIKLPHLLTLSLAICHLPLAFSQRI